MGNPAQDVKIAQGKRGFNRMILAISNGVQLYRNAFANLANDAGTVFFATPGATKNLPCGIVVGPANGSPEDSALLGNAAGTNKAVVEFGQVIKYAVTGGTSAALIGNYVYASDGQTLTTTPPGSTTPFGVIVGWISGTTCEVYLLSPIEGLQYKSTV